MINTKELIDELNKSCKYFFTNSTFHLHPSSANRFKITGDNPSKAINNYANSREEIDVIYWFDDFWIYVDIRFDNENIFISLSVFQGDATNNEKHQLFRAEWDDYNNIDEKHPQPHWHITANQVIERTFEELAGLEDSDTFVSLLEEEKAKVVDVNKIHFAMNANWINNDTHVHSLSNKDEIVRWFIGLLSHLKEELEYVL